MLLKNVEFPIFVIGSHKRLWSENNILYLESDRDIIYKLDNKNLSGRTLAERRLKINKEQRYKFTKTCFTIAQLIKSGKKLFLDNTGRLVKYRKDRRVNLIYRPIISAKPIEGKGMLVKVRGISTVFTISNFVFKQSKYIGLLVINDGYLVYELSDERKPDTWRKI